MSEIIQIQQQIFPSFKLSNYVTASPMGARDVVSNASRLTTVLGSFREFSFNEYLKENEWAVWAGLTKEIFQNTALTSHHQHLASARLRIDRLSALQSVLGFTIQDLAAVLRITRPQLYKWLDACNDIRLREASRERLEAVERIAKEWVMRSEAPLRSVIMEPLLNGKNILTLMCADVFDEAEIIRAFDELTAKLHDQPKSRSQLLRESGYTRRPSARSLPSDE